jgi:Domain of unknown function (DUF4381)
MAEAAAPLDAATRAALQKLADISVPPPVSWVPQTWGWAMLAVAVLALMAWMIARGARHYAANRYRREGLSELDRIEARLNNENERGKALAVMPALLKRVALAAWPRAEVAQLSGASWIAFLRAHAGKVGFPDDAAGLLDDLEYRSHQPVVSADKARRITGAVRNWIEGHIVSA